MNSVYEPIRRFVPEASGDLVIAYLKERKPRLKVKQPRKSKLGDYRSPATKGGPHTISVNGNLDPYQFLITLIHELAHLDNFVQYGRTVKPHGAEWKRCYQKLMAPFLSDPAVFPEELRTHLHKHMQNPTASSASNVELYKLANTKKKEVRAKEGLTLVEELPDGAHFFLAKKIFVKGHRMRKRFLCKDFKSGKEYSIHPHAEVIPLTPPTP